MRYLMDVISLDATLVKGSHGRPTDRPEDGPLFISSEPELLGAGPVAATDVKALILDHVFGSANATVHGERHDAAELLGRWLAAPIPAERGGMARERRRSAAGTGTPIASCILP